MRKPVVCATKTRFCKEPVFLLGYFGKIRGCCRFAPATALKKANHLHGKHNLFSPAKFARPLPPVEAIGGDG